MFERRITEDLIPTYPYFYTIAVCGGQASCS